jgi:multicomponent Na+:H+ antiporter subunit A
VNSLILQTASRTLFHTLVVFSLFMLFAGHNAPGGGFIGGLVVAIALALRYAAEGPDDVRRLVRVGAPSILGTGLLLAGGVGVTAAAAGRSFLESAVLDLHGLPLLGDVHVSSVVVFDAGVYLVVIGLTVAVLETLGGEAAP